MRMLLIATTVVLSLGVGGCGSEVPPASTATAPPAAAPVPSSGGPPAGAGSPGYHGDLPPLPPSAGPLQRPADVVRAVYAFAARRPDVLRYVPCFCGCEHSGHANNEDCFVARRGADGRPEWDAHGMG